MPRVEYEYVEVPCRVLNRVTGGAYTVPDLVKVPTFQTQTALTIARICGCGECECCLTLKEYRNDQNH